MKTPREIMYKTLVGNLSVDPVLLSRIEGDNPIKIELKGGEDIFIKIDENDNTLQTVVEIPFRDSRMLHLQAPKLLELLMSEDQENPIYMQFNKKRMLLLSSLKLNDKNVEKDLSDKLLLFNKVVNHLSVQ